MVQSHADVLEHPTVVIEPRKGLFDLDLKSLWQYHELLYFLIWREIKVRYKQTVIGAANLLKKVLARYVPPEILNKRKQGFAVQIKN